MAEANEKPRPFDVRTVRYLIRLMSQNDLTEIDLAEGEQRIRLRRGGKLVAAPTVAPAPLPAPVPTAAPTAAQPAPPAEKAGRKLIEIKSPTVGTFYSQKEPGAPPYISAGTRVSNNTVVCLIEAMKVYNEIMAECSGVVVEVCVNNKDFVEYNTVLFRVDPAG
ncbi:MAG: acetyl-CoA carboxylase biotin carboxyl carrier protein [Gemmataceae bacterium]